MTYISSALRVTHVINCILLFPAVSTVAQGITSTLESKRATSHIHQCEIVQSPDVLTLTKLCHFMPILSDLSRDLHVKKPLGLLESYSLSDILATNQLSV